MHKNYQFINCCGETSIITVDMINELEKPYRLSGRSLEALECWEPRPGEIYTISDGRENYYRGRLSELTPSAAEIIPFYKFPGPVETPVKLHVFQALPEKERFELILEKLTELGVNRITPFVSRRSISLEQRNEKQKKSHRWPKVLLRAAKQCRRAMIPGLTDIMTWEQMLKTAGKSDVTLILNEDEKNTLLKSSLKGITTGTVSLITGPEGGFTGEETGAVSAMGGKSVSLGNRILRTESASIIGSALIQYETGGFIKKI